MDNNLERLFHDGLKDIYYAERKILKTLPKMMEAAQDPDLKAAFQKHRDETEMQVERLTNVLLDTLGSSSRKRLPSRKMLWATARPSMPAKTYQLKLSRGVK